MYEPLLDDINVETLMDDNFETNTKSCDWLQGLEQEDPTLRDERKLEAQERPGTSEEEQEDGHLCHKRFIITITIESSVFDRSHLVIDSVPVEEREYAPVNT